MVATDLSFAVHLDLQLKDVCTYLPTIQHLVDNPASIHHPVIAVNVLQQNKDCQQDTQISTLQVKVTVNM